MSARRLATTARRTSKWTLAVSGWRLVWTDRFAGRKYCWDRRREKRMPQSLAQIYLHIVFSTKNRVPLLEDVALRDEMHNYLGGTCNQLDCPVLRVGGAADHVHILC